ncbi:hypothetical protein M422DRAFT_254752 [Sphaerobolus stellatus SS14]|uniref:Uncharacterized protein n=1 Tax=Sphaerobolus stellatus (strain SS14) TaxID=990650 RepID=A0A0C9VK82_SPHS4|nr:hypothetical protein M422DRAFT_254752 [Sphaerobolus stellatus SS14]
MDKTLSGEGVMSEKDKLLGMQIQEAEGSAKTIDETRKTLTYILVLRPASSSMQSRNVDMLSISPY